MFAVGLYTSVYAGTMYLYISKKPSNPNRHIIVTTTSILYLLCIGLFSIEWYYIDYAVVFNGDTRASILHTTLEGGPESIFVIYEFFFFLLFIVSDGILIWRCYHVWGKSLRIVLVPLILFSAQFCLFIADMILAGLIGSITENMDANLANNIQSAQDSFCILFGDFIFEEVVFACGTILVESAALYSTVIFVYALSIILPSFLNVSSTWSSGYYIECFVTVIGGLAPTILVARIALTTTSNEDMVAVTTHIPSISLHGSYHPSNSETSSRGEANELSYA
ncbi:hypothetical protein CVT25_003146 [Psilocybe cyanescens]|uniref:Uncharacterized protein n=1 Tax=Psilocybe cyanescens TaxID=93625 RepID=A0A409WMS5_PSICY|nr:hypothetical protein CVT25_003146 [Psilocybe cyanescens]